jgi:hypothetical protein
MIDRDDDVLLPRFYCVPQLRDWLLQRIVAYN